MRHFYCRLLSSVGLALNLRCICSIAVVSPPLSLFIVLPLLSTFATTATRQPCLICTAQCPLLKILDFDQFRWMTNNKAVNAVS